MSRSPATGAQSAPQLKRTLTLAPLSLYGLGTILGAGIYVLIGEVAARAGLYAPISFVVASLLAATSALSFAELSARIPESAGEAAYMRAAFNETLATATGLAVVLVGTISSATIAVGFTGYLREFLVLPDALAIAVLIVALGLIAAWGVSESVTFAGILTVVEIVGLVLVLVVAGPALGDLPERSHELLPELDASAWHGILLGAFIAFYAFIGFEDMVNMAEEVKEPQRTLPRGIFIALGVATLFYLALALVSVLAVPIDDLAGSRAPLARVYEVATGSRPTLLTAISLFAVSNGALIQIIMGARILYGLSKRRSRLAWLGEVHRRTRTPVRATAAVTAATLLLALLFPLSTLAEGTTLVTLTVFAGINLALWRIKKKQPAPEGVRTFPVAVPIAGALVSGGFLVYRIALAL